MLGIGVKSDPVVTATARLKAMTAQAASADTMVGRLIGTAAKLAAAYVTWRTAESIVKTFVESTIEADGVQRQLAAAVRSTGGAAQLTTRQLQDNASALQKLTSYGDEAIGSAEALLLTFTNIGKETFPDATAAVLDLATAMHTDLNGAAVQIGKALNNPVQGMLALTRVGVTFSAEQKRVIQTMVETNNIVGAQKEILKELNTEFGNSARMARGTLGGALSALQQAFGDLFELNGPPSERLRTAIEGIIEKLQSPSFISSVQNAGAAIFEMMSKLLPIVEKVLGGIDSWLSGHGQGFKAQTELGSKGSAMDFLRQKMIGGRSSPGGFAVDWLGDGNIVTGNKALVAKSYGMKDFGNMRDFYSQFTSDSAGGQLPDFGSYLVELGLNKPKKKSTITDDQMQEMDRQDAAYKKITLSAKQAANSNLLNAQSLGKSAEETARLQYQQQLLNQAANDNIKLSPKQREELMGLAAEMARTEAAAQQLTDIYNTGQDVFRSFFSDFKSNLMQGTSLWGSFANAAVNAMNKIADKALGAAADGIWNLIFGAVTGGLTGSSNSASWVNAAASIFKPSANGNVFGGGITGHVNQIVSRPTVFPFAKGIGLMGEAGSEAVMPLKRNASGQLGVMVDGGAGVTHINFYNVSQGDLPAMEKWANNNLVPKLKRHERRKHRSNV